MAKTTTTTQRPPQFPLLPKAVVDVFGYWGGREKDITAKPFNPKAPYFSMSSWESGTLIESLENTDEVEGIILEKLRRSEDESFDLQICNANGKEITWETIVLLKVEK